MPSVHKITSKINFSQRKKRKQTKKAIISWRSGKEKHITSCVRGSRETSSLCDLFSVTSMAGTDTEKKPVLEMVSLI